MAKTSSVDEDEPPVIPKPQSERLRVGCALLPKKVSRYLTPAMKAAASDAGIELLLIDRAKPLAEQGPFNAIIHKLRPSKEWERELQEYARSHPGVKVIDSVDGIRTLRNRATMLSALEGDGIVMKSREDPDQRTVRVQAPVQIDVPEGTSPEQLEALLSAAGLHMPPWLVKPLWTDGREGSHGLAVVYDLLSLQRLLDGAACSSSFRPPVVIQQFVEHGGVLHKVYVLGETTVVCKRPSLGDKYLGSGKERQQGVLQLPRISCTNPSFDTPRRPASGLRGCGPGDEGPPLADDAYDPDPAHDSAWPACLDSEELLTPSSRPGSPDEGSHRPAEWVTRALAQQLRARLGLQLFNFDLICPEDQSMHGEEQLFYVVDINYFPGVDKIPNFEHAFVQFLRATCLREDHASQPRP